MQIEQPHRVRDRGAAAPDFLRDVLLPHAEFAGKTGIGLRFLNRIEIGALEIFDQRKFEHFQIVCAANDRGHFGQSQLLRGAQDGVRRRSIRGRHQPAARSTAE